MTRATDCRVNDGTDWTYAVGLETWYRVARGHVLFVTHKSRRCYCWSVKALTFPVPPPLASGRTTTLASAKRDAEWAERKV